MGVIWYLVDEKRLLGIELGKGLWTDVFPSVDDLSRSQPDYDAWKRSGVFGMAVRFKKELLPWHEYTNEEIAEIEAFAGRVYQFCETAGWQDLHLSPEDDWDDTRYEGAYVLVDSIDRGVVRMTEADVKMMCETRAELYEGHDDLGEICIDLLNKLYADLVMTRLEVERLKAAAAKATP